MKQAKVNYKKKCKSRKVDFYLHDQDLYNFSKEINFNKFVKNCLTIVRYNNIVHKEKGEERIEAIANNIRKGLKNG